MIPYGRQEITQQDIDAVVEVLHSDLITQGPVVPAFEKKVAEYCGAKYSIAVNSATSALHLACLALDIGNGDVVWTTPITFVASANCALYCGATIDFVDIDPNTYNMSVNSLTEKLKTAKSQGNLPKVVIPVHLCGQSCNMSEIYLLSLRYGFKVIEDASHAIGGRYKNEPVGNCRFSDITIFSFHPVKLITTGEGGMAVTNDIKLQKKMTLLRSHGITRDIKEMTHEPEGAWYYQQVELGYNYRMTDLQAALGISQLKRLDKYISQRHMIAKQYHDLLKTSSVLLPWQDSDNFSAFHLYVIRLKIDRKYNSRSEVFDKLRNAGIGVNVHYIPVYHQPYYANFGYNIGYCPEAEKYYAEAISIPIYPGLTKTEQLKVTEAITNALI